VNMNVNVMQMTSDEAKKRMEDLKKEFGDPHERLDFTD